MNISNMSKRFSINIAVLALVVTGLVACTDGLNRVPSDTPSSENFFSSRDELETALTGVYEGTLYWFENYPSQPGWMAPDDVTDLGFERSTGEIQAVADGSASASNGFFQSTWEHFYAAIGRANNLLTNMSRAEGNAPEEYMQRVEAEAKFLRAYSYSYLTELYGDVPLLTTVPSLEEAEQSRTPKSEVVDKIVEDLDFAAQVLPEEVGSSEQGRATSGAALALKARVALYNERWQVAAQAARQVMDSGVYTLHPDFREVFQLEGQRNSGVIFDVPYQRGVQTHGTPRRQQSRNLSGWSQHVPSQAAVDMFQGSDGEPIDESSVYDTANPFEDRDPRLDGTIVRPGSVLGGYVFETHPDSTQTFRIVDGDSIRVDNEDVLNPFATFTGYLWRKYNDPDDIPQNVQSSEHNFILIRYAEVLLTYAEAKIEMDDVDQSVIDAMNRVRARGYGVSPSNTNQYPAFTMTASRQELRRQVRYERTVEFMNEGLRLFDIRRWGIAADVMDGPLIGRPKGAYSTIPSPPEIDDATGYPDYSANRSLYRTVKPRSFNPDRDNLWAIPQSEIDANDEISQNPGY